MDVTGRGKSSSDLAFDLIIFVAESIPFAHSTSQAPEISAVQHLASTCLPWPVIFSGCQSESQQQSEALSAVFWKSSILQGKSIFKANVEMLSPPVWYGVMRACNVGFSSNFMTSYLHTFLAPLLQNPVSCDCQKYLTWVWRLKSWAGHAMASSLGDSYLYCRNLAMSTPRHHSGQSSNAGTNYMAI